MVRFYYEKWGHFVSRVTKLLIFFLLWLRLLLFDLYGAPECLDGFVDLAF